MKKHFKYGISAEGFGPLGRPILSTRQAYQSFLQQKVQEEKVLETLKSNNEKEQYEEFRNAQQVAAAMMDIVQSSQSGDMILDPQDGQLTREQLCTTLKMDQSLAEKSQGKQTLHNDGTTLDLLSQTGKSSRCRGRQSRKELQHSPRSRTRSRQGIAQAQAEKPVMIEVRNEMRESQHGSGSRSPAVNSDLLVGETARAAER